MIKQVKITKYIEESKNILEVLQLPLLFYSVTNANESFVEVKQISIKYLICLFDLIL